MPLMIPVFLLLLLIYVSFKRVMEYERLVVFVLGKFQTVKGPGIRIVVLIPGP